MSNITTNRLIFREKVAINWEDHTKRINIFCWELFLSQKVLHTPVYYALRFNLFKIIIIIIQHMFNMIVMTVKYHHHYYYYYYYYY